MSNFRYNIAAQWGPIMLLVAHGISQIELDRLASVYDGHIQEMERRMPSPYDRSERHLAAIQSFYESVRLFFREEGAAYYILQDQSRYVAALRVQAYEDGLLLCCLETAPGDRRKGYATDLMKQTVSALRNLGYERIYSHVNRRNVPSCRVHESCGFREISKHSVFLDGRVDTSSSTLCLELKGTPAN